MMKETYINSVKFYSPMNMVFTTADGKDIHLSDLLEVWEQRQEEKTTAIEGYKRGFNSGIREAFEFIRRGGNHRQLKKYTAFHVENDLRYYISYPRPAVLPELWGNIKKRILERDNYICHYCGNKANTADHKKPVVSGGTDDDENLVAVCNSCNFKKSTSSYQDFVSKTKRLQSEQPAIG